ncbi:hypothetical protein EVAR_43918_1 [Eumeta japonica]|uniref:Uncharacterized protein n=1 Tax=Eumeta variegata TaxID=151549 RepID=A0A4C1WRI1_EUMVA|nr:hypothetical protein EVAR_43918_1 [Eumeta japonica]
MLSVPTPFSVRYHIPTREVANAPVTAPESRVSTGGGRVRSLSLFYSDTSADGVEERSLVPRSRSYAWANIYYERTDEYTLTHTYTVKNITFLLVTSWSGKDWLRALRYDEGREPRAKLPKTARIGLLAVLTKRRKWLTFAAGEKDAVAAPARVTLRDLGRDCERGRGRDRKRGSTSRPFTVTESNSRWRAGDTTASLKEFIKLPLYFAHEPYDNDGAASVADSEN